MRTTRWIQAGLCVGLLVSSGAVRAQTSPSRAAEAQNKGDQEFLEQALAVNQLELQLGRLAIQRATTPEIKTMGQKMLEKHTELGRQLGGLAQSSGASTNVQLSPAQRETYQQLAESSGAVFDSTFKQTVDAIHVKELAMYRAELPRATNPQLRALVEGRVAKLEEATAKTEPPRGGKQTNGW
jgi:putative membrane protein